MAARFAHAGDQAPTQGDFGGAGLWQTPTARMADEGELALSVSRVEPYSRYNFTAQPLSWLEGSFRYTRFDNDAAPVADGGRSNSAKAFDAKIRLSRESRYLPEVAVGARDIAGKRYFSSEYVVANKRFGPVDASLGVAWGNLGARGNLANPLSALDDRFDHRPSRSGFSDARYQFDRPRYFHGRAAVFGGVAYRPAGKPWEVKVEYDGNDYRHEPGPLRIKQSSPFNVGVVYRPNRHLDLSLGLQRGNTASFALTLHTNAARLAEPIKAKDPPPVARRYDDAPAIPTMAATPAAASVHVPAASATAAAGPAAPTALVSGAIAATSAASPPLPQAAPSPGLAPLTAISEAGVTPQTGLPPIATTPASTTQTWPEPAAPEQVDWEQVSRELYDNAGVRVSKISRRGSELFVTGEQTRYRHSAKGLGRTARILDNQVDGSVDWYTLVSTRAGMEVVETSVQRERFGELLDGEADLKTFRLGVERNRPQARREELLYRAPLDRYDGGFGLSVGHELGAPDTAALYKIGMAYDADYRFASNLWLSGRIEALIADNYDRYDGGPVTALPRVRSDVREYVTSSRVTMPQLQLTAAGSLGADWYGMAYVGMLESMYGGAGAETLYRPFGQRWAIGADVNWVRQRSFDQDFSFRRYRTVTGHVSAYIDTGYKDISLKVSAGRYLARDWGATVDVSRQFNNGVRMGAYATFTEYSPRQPGDGGFDRGLYLSVPFDLARQRSSRSRADFAWSPGIRDNGARLNKRYGLYSLTEDRDRASFSGNLHGIVE
ncbi:YjbH domain-containing protein [Lysobacter sp. 22409]|uniref:YjbH domain-containing protein n=1 Tax=Lysobacter sp. 22409 TaxID=3453917 RepID=UPI003F843C82